MMSNTHAPAPPPPPPPRGLRWRSHSVFILATVGLGMFTDLFLYGLVVPVLPFVLRDRVRVPDGQIQAHVSGLLAAYAGVQLLFSVPVGWVADRTRSRRLPFLCGLAALLAGTILLAVGRTVAALVAARLLQGTSAAVVWTIGLAMVMDTVGPRNIGKVVGTIFSFISVGELLAPVLGGILYDKTGYLGVFGVGAGILVLDFLMRLLVIEKKEAAQFDPSLAEGTNARDFASRGEEADAEASESDALLPKPDGAEYKVEGEPGRLVRLFPVLYCFRNPRLWAAFLLAFVQASLLATFDATIPTEAKDVFGFTSLQAGLLFIALDIPYLVLGPLAGWAVDRYGTKPAAVVGFGYLVPALVLLRLPSEKMLGGTNNVVLYCAILALNGIGMAVIGSPSFVEASDVVQRYDKANPGFFGDNGPYAQLYGFNSVFFCAGLTAGPIVAGTLRDTIGYGNMNAVFAAAAGVTAVASFLFIGGKPKLLSRAIRG